jgi:hypothetical protein
MAKRRPRLKTLFATAKKSFSAKMLADGLPRSHNIAAVASKFSQAYDESEGGVPILHASTEAGK